MPLLWFPQQKNKKEIKFSALFTQPPKMGDSKKKKKKLKRKKNSSQVVYM
jgi:hypothetical protein